MFEQRKKEILELIEIEGCVSVKHLSNLFDVSEVTIRRDLEHLEKEKYLKRVHGGASLNSLIYKINKVTEQNEEVITKIAKYAYDNINSGDMVLLDSSKLSHEISIAIKRYHEKKLIVISNSNKIHTVLEDSNHVELFHLGGYYDRISSSGIGQSVIDMLKTLYVTKLFIGVDGIDINAGFTIQNSLEFDIKQAMIRSAKEVFILVTSSCFNLTFLRVLCNFNEKHHLITDQCVPKKYIDLYNTIDSVLTIV